MAPPELFQKKAGKNTTEQEPPDEQFDVVPVVRLENENVAYDKEPDESQIESFQLWLCHPVSEGKNQPVRAQVLQPEQPQRLVAADPAPLRAQEVSCVHRRDPKHLRQCKNNERCSEEKPVAYDAPVSGIGQELDAEQESSHNYQRHETVKMRVGHA